MTKQTSHNFSEESSDCFPTLVAAGQHRQGLGDLVRLFFRLDFNNFKHFYHFYLGLQFRLDGFHASLKTTFVSILQLFADFSDASKEVSPTKFEKKNSGHHQPPRTSVSSPDPKQGTKLSGTSRLGSDVSASKPDPLTAADPKQPENINLNPRPAANFNLNEKVSNLISSLANRAKPGYLSHATKPFSVDDVKTFIDADSIIDYGSLATTQPIDVDEALGALDSLKFVKAEQKLPELSNQELRERVARKEKEVEEDLEDAIAKIMLPTPTSGSKNSQHSIAEWGGSGNPLRNIPGAYSQLNPRFVAEMMGFPPNWTELPFQSGEQNP